MMIRWADNKAAQKRNQNFLIGRQKFLNNVISITTATVVTVGPGFGVASVMNNNGIGEEGSINNSGIGEEGLIVLGFGVATVMGNNGIGREGLINNDGIGKEGEI